MSAPTAISDEIHHYPLLPHNVPVSIASTPDPPYTAVIFTSIRTDVDNGYAAIAEAMDELAAEQPGYLGVESARENIGITVSPTGNLRGRTRLEACQRTQPRPEAWPRRVVSGVSGTHRHRRA